MRRIVAVVVGHAGEAAQLRVEGEGTELTAWAPEESAARVPVGTRVVVYLDDGDVVGWYHEPTRFGARQDRPD